MENLRIPRGPSSAVDGVGAESAGAGGQIDGGADLLEQRLGVAATESGVGVISLAENALSRNRPVGGVILNGELGPRSTADAARVGGLMEGPRDVGREALERGVEANELLLLNNLVASGVEDGVERVVSQRVLVRGGGRLTGGNIDAGPRISLTSAGLDKGLELGDGGGPDASPAVSVAASGDVLPAAPDAGVDVVALAVNSVGVVERESLLASQRGEETVGPVGVGIPGRIVEGLQDVAGGRPVKAPVAGDGRDGEHLDTAAAAILVRVNAVLNASARRALQATPDRAGQGDVPLGLIEHAVIDAVGKHASASRGLSVDEGNRTGHNGGGKDIDVDAVIVARPQVVHDVVAGRQISGSLTSAEDSEVPFSGVSLLNFVTPDSLDPRVGGALVGHVGIVGRRDVGVLVPGGAELGRTSSVEGTLVVGTSSCVVASHSSTQSVSGSSESGSSVVLAIGAKHGAQRGIQELTRGICDVQVQVARRAAGGMESELVGISFRDQDEVDVAVVSCRPLHLEFLTNGNLDVRVDGSLSHTRKDGGFGSKYGVPAKGTRDGDTIQLWP